MGSPYGTTRSGTVTRNREPETGRSAIGSVIGAPPKTVEPRYVRAMNEGEPPLALTDAALAVARAAAGGERVVLETFLDFYRDVVVRKIRGLTDEDARRRLVPSLTTLAGILTHLTVVERNWFLGVLGQRPETIVGSITDDPSWTAEPNDSVEDIVARYEQACAESRRAAAEFGLDHVVPHPELGQVSLRWIYVHMIEETARHAGHADILRELTDGAVGVLG